MVSKRPSQSKQSGANTVSSERLPVTTDPRFALIHSDQRFAPPKRTDTAIRLDSRFSGVLTDSRFTSKPSVDRYGRRLPQESGKRELSRFYDLDSDDDDDGKDERRFDPARGEGLVDTSSESESEDDDDEGDEKKMVGVDEERLAREKIQEDDVPTGEVSQRLAVVNLDWDNVRAVDLMKAFMSFAPTGGKVVRVAVYPSEFGRERMEREEVEGPPRELFRNEDEGDDEDTEDENGNEEEINEKTILKEDKGEEFDSAKLRRYQLERLRYYYAVVYCDSERTAKHIYDNCDGAEYEATANFFDLRFVPDETSFDDDKPRDECAQDPMDYTPADFVTDALQHSKVRLTWDEDDVQRKQVSKRAFSQRDIEENELKAYLASSDSESDNEEKKTTTKEKYRALLGGLTFGKGKAEPVGDMKVTFTSGLDEKGDDDDNDAKVLENDVQETTIEKYVRKERERKKARKEKLKSMHEGGEHEPPAATTTKTITNKNTKKNRTKLETEEDSNDKAAIDLGFDDPFFEEPIKSNSSARKAEKQKRREEKSRETAEAASKRAELELLMADDDGILGQSGQKLSHFNMKAVVKAEKLRNKKSKSKKRKKGMDGLEADDVQDDFKIDVKDPRFSAVFERHDFAIDPTNPRFVKTEATKKLMEERRKRSATMTTASRGTRGEIEEGGDRDGRESKRKKIGTKQKQNKKKDEIQSLVQSLKQKSMASKV